MGKEHQSRYERALQILMVEMMYTTYVFPPVIPPVPAFTIVIVWSSRNWQASDQSVLLGPGILGISSIL
jgi:hypothetical protein